MGNLIIAIFKLSILLIKTFPKVAIPTILLTIGAVYFNLISKGEVVLAFVVFIVLFFIWTFLLGFVDGMNEQRLTKAFKTRSLAATFALSLFLSGFFISEIRSTDEQRMTTKHEATATAAEKRENKFLKSYSPNGIIAFITSTSEMTDYGRRLFYLNDPKLISTQSQLNSICKTNTSHIDVSTLGCYSQRDNTIYLLDNDSGITNNLLVGTAAHELLHSVYVNLPHEELRQVNEALLDVWNGPKHNYLVKRLSAYDFAERSSDHLNELHSIIGTEVANLPDVLVEHYAKYFNQSKVYKISSLYNKKVAGKRAAVANLNKNLNDLRKKIEFNKKQIAILVEELNEYKQDMSRYKALKNTSDYYISKYNELVPIFNDTVSKINDLEVETQSFISEYNEAIPTLNSKIKDLKRFSSIKKS